MFISLHNDGTATLGADGNCIVFAIPEDITAKDCKEALVKYAFEYLGLSLQGLLELRHDADRRWLLARAVEGGTTIGALFRSAEQGRVDCGHGYRSKA